MSQSAANTTEVIHVFKFHYVVSLKKSKKKKAGETCDTNVYQYEETSEMPPWHLTRLQPLLRDNAVQIGCRLQSSGHCILNKLHKCPAICCLPPYHPVFVNVQMLKCWLMRSAFWFRWLSFHCEICRLT